MADEICFTSTVTPDLAEPTATTENESILDVTNQKRCDPFYVKNAIDHCSESTTSLEACLEASLEVSVSLDAGEDCDPISVVPVDGSTAAATPDPDPDPFTDGYSIEFDLGRSDADHVDFPTGTFTETDGFSVAIWYQPHMTLSSSRFPLGKWDPIDLPNSVMRVGYGGGIYAGRPELHMYGDTSTGSPAITHGLWIARGGGVVTLNAWNFLVYVYDPDLTEARIYMNGAKQSVTYVRPAPAPLSRPNVPDNLSTSSKLVQLNPHNGGYAGGYAGYIGEAALFDHAITDAQATEIWNGGAPMHDWSALTFAGNMTWWCRCGDGDTYPTLLDNVGSNDGTMVNMDAGDIVTDVP